MNILVLDDEREIADLVEVYLKNENYNVFKFYDAKEAINCIESQKLDFAILDVMIKDVDGFNPINVGKLCLNQETFVSCTPYGIMKMFEEYDIDLTGKNVTILGRSNIVGKPLIQCCLNKNATVTVCHSKTKDLKEHTKNADIVISAIGKAKFVTADMIKDGAVVIDVGINRDESGKIVGDVDFEKVSSKASYITPVPGGVGPMTIAMLMNNVIKATKLQNRRSETL